MTDFVHEHVEALARLGGNPWRDIVDRVAHETLRPPPSIAYGFITWSASDTFHVVVRTRSGRRLSRSGSVSMWTPDGNLLKLGIWMGRENTELATAWFEFSEEEFRTELYWLMQGQ